jgi:DNA-binding transcriptional MerR regulator
MSTHALLESIHTTEDLLTIGQLAKACGVTVRALRHYEALQLIQATMRSEGGYRLYSGHTQRRIRAIIALQDLSYRLDDIRNILGDALPDPTHLPKAQRIERTRQLLDRQKNCLNEKISELTHLQSHVLERLHVLEAHCTPCHTLAPDANNCDRCEHQDTHYD